MSLHRHMFEVTDQVSIPSAEIEFQAIRAQGAGGQNVNKVSTAVHLRFDIKSSSLPEACKEKLMMLNDQRISADGVVIIKAQEHRSQLKNRQEALNRLRELVRSVSVSPKQRHATRPTRASQEKRLQSKIKRGKSKSLRRKVDEQ